MAEGGSIIKHLTLLTHHQCLGRKPVTQLPTPRYSTSHHSFDSHQARVQKQYSGNSCNSCSFFIRVIATWRVFKKIASYALTVNTRKHVRQPV